MEKFLAWWKKEKRYILFFKAALAACLPILCCLVYCAAQGRSLGEVYLPASEWNDELFYYKQVENILHFGYPQGYFGFNESHALKLSFAAWSPVLVSPWLLWGMLFGWNFMSPILCNIVLLTAAVFLFVWMTKPSGKQMGILILLFCLYTPFVRYMLSGMPEIICFSLLIVFYGLVMNYLKKESAAKLGILFLIAGLLTLMRPYMLLFLLLPAILCVLRERQRGRTLRGVCISGVVCGGVLALYALIKHYLGAEYFHPLFFTDWLTTFFTSGLKAGFHNFCGTLYWKGKDFCAHTIQGFRSGLASGAFFATYLVMMAVLIGQSVADLHRIRRAKRQETEPDAGRKADISKGVLAAELHLAFSFVAMLFALLLMYKLTEGSKHLLTFLAAGIFVVGMMRTKCYRKAVLIGATFAFFFTYMAVDPYDYQVPFVTQERQDKVELWRENFAETLELSSENTPNYDNVVIWTLNDSVDGKGIATRWQLLYGLPEGFGISCCTRDYVIEHLAELKSRYLAVVPGGEIDAMCTAAGYEELARDDELVLFRLH